MKFEMYLRRFQRLTAKDISLEEHPLIKRGEALTEALFGEKIPDITDRLSLEEITQAFAGTLMLAVDTLCDEVEELKAEVEELKDASGDLNGALTDATTVIEALQDAMADAEDAAERLKS